MAPRNRPTPPAEPTPVREKPTPLTRAVPPDAKAQARRRQRSATQLANDRRANVFANAPGRAQMAMTNPKRSATISSSALRQIGDDSTSTRRRRRNRAQTDRQWQQECFDYAKKVGELGALLNLQANIVSLCGFPVRRWDEEQADWVANEPDPKPQPIPEPPPPPHPTGPTIDPLTGAEVPAPPPPPPPPPPPKPPEKPPYDDRPANVMRSFVGPDGGSIDLIRRAAYNLFCAGDATLLGTAHPKDEGILWEFLSVLELYPNADGDLTRRRGGMGSPEEKLPDDNFTARLYRSDIAYSDLADSEVKRVLPILQEIVTLTMMVDAIAKSRLAANMIFIPDELSFAGASDPDDDADPDDVENSEEVDADDIDELVDELFDHMTAPVTDSGSAARLVPLVIRGKGEFGQYIKVIDLSRQLDMWAQELRQEALSRLANGLDAPPEAISGKGNVNHWTAANIDSEFIVKHIQPIGILIADFLTWAYLRPMLEGYEEMSPEEAMQYKIEFDPSPVIARADEAKSARDLSEWLSDEALMAANGFTKADMADDETIRLRRLWTLVSTQPTTFAKLITLLPGFQSVDPDIVGTPPPPDPTTGYPIDTNPGRPAPDDGKEPATGNQQPDPATAPSSQNSDRANQLSLLVERLTVAGDAAISQALGKAGSRIISLSQSKAPELRERLRGAKKDRMMSLVQQSDLAQFSMTPEKLLRGAWDDLGPQCTAWVRDFLESDGMEEMAAHDVAAMTSRRFVEMLDEMTTTNLLKSWTPARGKLRVSTDSVLEIVEQAAFAGAV